MSVSRRLFAGRPFSLVTSMASGQPATMARFVCACCGAKHEMRVAADRSINPEAVAKKARDTGWDAPLHGERATCPRCLQARKSRAAGESPNAPSSPIQPIPTAEVIPMTKPQPAPVPPRQLTQDERFRIRAILDKQFDDSRGAYLDGYSDQKVATEANVPRIHVETIREAAFGPIKEDPEVARARSEWEAMKNDLNSMAIRVAEFGNRLSKLAGGAPTQDPRA